MGSDFRIVHRRNDTISKHEEAEVARALGWSILVLAAIPALFIPIGLLTASLFWLWWTALQAAIGLGALVASAYMRKRTERPAHRVVYKPTAVEQAEAAAENYQPKVA